MHPASQDAWFFRPTPGKRKPHLRACVQDSASAVQQFWDYSASRNVVIVAVVISTVVSIVGTGGSVICPGAILVGVDEVEINT